MTSHAEGSVFWPGITSDIHNMRAQCSQSNRMARLSRTRLCTTSYVSLPISVYICRLLQLCWHQLPCHRGSLRQLTWCTCGKDCGWSKMPHIHTSLRRTWIQWYQWWAAVSFNGGPEFSSTATNTFLKNWGAWHRVSSVAYPHSNCRAEVGVKTVKRLITDTTSARGNLDTDAFQGAMLQYRNTPDKETKLSPAQCLFTRSLCQRLGLTRSMRNKPRARGARVRWRRKTSEASLSPEVQEVLRSKTESLNIHIFLCADLECQFKEIITKKIIKHHFFLLITT